MKSIEEMIKELCPEGVERLPLSNFCLIMTGKLNANAMEDNGIYPFFTCSDCIYKINTYAFDLEALLVAGNGYLGSVKYYNGKFNAYQRTYVLNSFDSRLQIRYAYYYMVAFFREHALKSQKEGSIPYITIKSFETFLIPLPPLPIQQQIVDTLDKFTSLISNIDKEIELRQKQYEHYREKLLTFSEDDESVEWKKISEIGKLVRGNGLQKKDFTESGTGCIHYGQIYTKLGFSLSETLTFVPTELASKLTKVDTGDLVIACTSENVEDVCKSVVWLGKEQIVTGGHACVFKHNEEPKYIGYCFLTSNFFLQKKKVVYGAKVIDIKTDKLGEIKLPISSPSRQREIVSTLDKFEAMLANLKRERELRQKQYEYYREKLLTF